VVFEGRQKVRLGGGAVGEKKSDPSNAIEKGKKGDERALRCLRTCRKGGGREVKDDSLRKKKKEVNREGRGEIRRTGEFFSR